MVLLGRPTREALKKTEDMGREWRNGNGDKWELLAYGVGRRWHCMPKPTKAKAKAERGCAALVVWHGGNGVGEENTCLARLCFKRRKN